MSEEANGCSRFEWILKKVAPTEAEVDFLLQHQNSCRFAQYTLRGLEHFHRLPLGSLSTLRGIRLISRRFKHHKHLIEHILRKVEGEKEMSPLMKKVLLKKVR